MKNVCITGFGAIGPVHAAALKNTDNASFYAVCDINDERLEKCKSEYGVKGFKSFDEMLTDDKIDSVHICTPHYLHYEMIVKALNAGKTVICEKPVVMKKEEFKQLLQNKISKNVAVTFQNRLNPSIIKLKEIIDSSTFGKILGVKGFLTWHRTAEYYNADEWRGKYATEGGGVLINQAIHSLDLICYLIGRVESVKAHIGNYSIPEIEVEDTAVAYLSFENNINGIFFATNSYVDDSCPNIEIKFENGVAEYKNKKLFINNLLETDDISSALGKVCWGSGHTPLIKNYYEKNIYFTPQDVANTMHTIFAIYESAENGGKEIHIGDE